MKIIGQWLIEYWKRRSQKWTLPSGFPKDFYKEGLSSNFWSIPGLYPKFVFLSIISNLEKNRAECEGKIMKTYIRNMKITVKLRRLSKNMCTYKTKQSKVQWNLTYLMSLSLSPSNCLWQHSSWNLAIMKHRRTSSGHPLSTQSCRWRSNPLEHLQRRACSRPGKKTPVSGYREGGQRRNENRWINP